MECNTECIYVEIRIVGTGSVQWEKSIKRPQGKVFGDFDKNSCDPYYEKLFELSIPPNGTSKLKLRKYQRNIT